MAKRRYSSPARCSPDVVTLDVLMPQMDGWAVLSAMMGDAALAKIPVIMVTIVDNQSIGFSFGAADYLIKPMTSELSQTAKNST